MSKDNVWVESENGVIQSVPQYIPTSIEAGIYQVNMNPMTGLYLSRISKSFKLPKKIYNIESTFIQRALKSFREISGNLGIILNGIKGTGKTITAKLIAQQSNLPILLVEHPFEGLPAFISKIDFDCVIFIDEYEKVFNGDERGILLSVMDGVQNPHAKIMYLLTTNSLRVNENLVNRPSRIRYLKEYGDLPKETISEILEDLLENKEFMSDALTTISELNQITMDSVVEIIKEINIHNESPTKFIKFFNISQDNQVYTYNMLDKETGELIFTFPTNSFISPSLPTGVWMRSYDSDVFSGSMKIIKHIDHDHFEVEYTNPEYMRLRREIDEREEKMADSCPAKYFDENDFYDESKDSEMISLRAQFKNCPASIKRIVRYAYKPSKNWQYR